MRDARFEVVRNQDGNGWHARFRAANGRIVWWTETYAKRKAAVRAVELICSSFVRETPWNDHPEVTWEGNQERPTEVHFLDERTSRP